MNFRDFLKENIVYLDGGMGTLLQGFGLAPGEFPERWNISHPEIITKIHKGYFDAGSNVVSTNTFGANCIKFSDGELEEIIKAAVENVKQASDESSSKREKFIALDIGPTGKMLKPFGDLDFEDAVEVFAKTVRLGAKCGVDLILIETMNDSYETKAALLAAKENSSLPVLVSNAYGEDKKLMTGATPSAMVALLEGMGADAIGANCSLGPIQLREVVYELLDKASVPVLVKPNAGLPKVVDGKTVFDVDAIDFANEVSDFIRRGVRVAGGCCGTTPEYISELVKSSGDIFPKAISDKEITVVSSYTHAVEFGKSPILIGERINPTGKKRLKQALIEQDMEYILTEGVNQQDKGVHILDVNVGLPEINEKEMLENAVCEIQSVINLPLQIDTADFEAMESALRQYNGKALINSVNGKKESMEKVFPLVKKYGGVVIALTLDENGIPNTAEGRFRIAEKILETAREFGIGKKNIVFDTLAMAISAEKCAARETLGALKMIKEQLGCHTSLGVSNVSFGLPNRDAVNSTFFALALSNGLSAAIMNPHSADMMKTYYSYKALSGLDENCADYIGAAETFVQVPVGTATDAKKVSASGEAVTLAQAIEKGFKEKAGEITSELLENTLPLEIVQNEIIPALNKVGEGFENKKVYLPGLLMSAEAAKSAFEKIKDFMKGSNEKSVSKGTVIIATVKGDIHDIGKNIVKLLLENYGFDVIDMGKDVPPAKIVEIVVEKECALVGLSALMTTTVPAMEETIRQLKECAPWCKTVVGGAVLTKDYAEKIGADKYAKDAMETVRYAESIFA